MNRTILLVAGAGLFGIGVWLGHRAHESVPPATNASLDINNKRSSAAAGQQHRQAAPPSSFRDWQHLLAEVDTDEVPGLLAAAQDIRDWSLRSFVLSRLLEVWASDDPEAAITWVDQAKNRSYLDLRGVFRVWAERDPATAARHLSRFVRASDARLAAAAIADAWCSRDLPATIAWAKQLESSHTRFDVFGTILQHLAQTDPQQAVALALSLEQPASSSGRLRTIVTIQAATDPAAALQTINNLPPGVPRGPLYQGVVRALAAEDPKLAGEFALTLPAGEYQTDALHSVATRLADQSPQAALDWVASAVPAGPVRSTLLRDVLMSVATTNPPAAAPLLGVLGGNDRVNVALNLVGTWIRLDPDAATSWALQLPADRTRASIMSSLAFSWTCSMPTAALAFTLQHTNQQEQARMLQKIGIAWPVQTPTEARTVLAQLPTDDARKNFVDGMVSSLGRRQPQAAAELVASLPAGAVHDSAARAYIANAAYADLPLASRVAHSIADNSLRADALTSIARIWLTKDRAATTAWLATTDLPEATKQQLLAPTP